MRAALCAFLIAVAANAATTQTDRRIEDLRNPEKRARATSYLIAHHDESLPRLLDVIANDSTLRDEAADVVVGMGAAAVRPIHARLLDERHSSFLDAVFVRLGDPALRLLIDDLASPDRSARMLAAVLVGRFGAKLQPVLPQIIAGLRDANPQVREFLLTALLGDDLDVSSAEAAVMPFLDHAPETRFRALQVLSRIRPLPAVVLPALIVMLRAAEIDGMREAIVLQLGAIGPDAAPAEPVLEEMASQIIPGHRLRMIIAESLKKIGPSTDAGRRALADIGRDEERKRKLESRFGRFDGDLKRIMPALDDPELAPIVLVTMTLPWIKTPSSDPTTKPLIVFINTTRDSLARDFAIPLLMAHAGNGRFAQPIALEALSSPHGYTRACAAWFFFHHPDAAATARLVEMARSDRDARARLGAVHALPSAPGLDADLHERVLAEAVLSDDEDLRREAEPALMKLGPAATTAARLIFAAPYETQQRLFGVLTRIAPDDPRTIEHALELLVIDQNRDWVSYFLAGHADANFAGVVEAYASATEVQRALMTPKVQWIVSLAQHPERSLPRQLAIELVEQLMADANCDVRITAMQIAGRYREAAAPLAQTIARRLGDEDEVRRAAADALAAIGPSAAPLLAGRLGDSSPAVRSAAASALRKQRALTDSEVPALLAAAQDADAGVRLDAIIALRSIKGTSAELATLLRSKRVETRRLVAANLPYASYHRDALPEPLDGSVIVPALRAALEDPDGEVVRAAAWTLPLWRDAAVSAEPQLERLLRSRDRQIRLAAGRALRRIEGLALEPLVRALRDDDPAVRAGAAECLGVLFDRAADARPDIEIASNDRDPRVRDAAAVALARIGQTLRTELEFGTLEPRSTPRPPMTTKDYLRIDFVVTPDGNVVDPVVREGVSPAVNEAAVRTIAGWTYAPTGAYVALTKTFGEQR